MEKKHTWKLDANESVFFKRQLEYIKRRTYDTKYKNLKYASLIPVSTEAGPAATQITYRTFSKVGRAKVIADYANDFPRADAFAVENTINVKSVGDSYGYSIQEIRQSQMAGVQLDRRRADAARRAIEEELNSIAWFGDADWGLGGFLTNPNISKQSYPHCHIVRGVFIHICIIFYMFQTCGKLYLSLTLNDKMTPIRELR